MKLTVLYLQRQQRRKLLQIQKLYISIDKFVYYEKTKCREFDRFFRIQAADMILQGNIV